MCCCDFVQRGVPTDKSVRRALPADVGDGDDPGRQLTHRPLEIAIAYASATGRRLG
jgi:hypothetical protein